MPNKPETCGNCRYYFGVTDARGKCKRYPPQFPKGDGEHVLVDVTDWCGEWEVKK